MTEFMGVDIQEYKWKPYPSQGLAERDAATELSASDKKIPEDKRHRLNEIQANYAGKLIDHRAHNKSNFEFLLYIQREFKRQGDDTSEIETILQEHIVKERNVNTITKNQAFREALNYTYKYQEDPEKYKKMITILVP